MPKKRSANERKSPESSLRERKPAEKPLTRRQASKFQYGVATDFDSSTVEQIFEAKAAGQSISAVAHRLGTTRDKVRTIFNSPSAPPAGLPPVHVVKGKPVHPNEHLEKAKAALEAARALHENLTPGELFENKELHKEFLYLMDLVSIQAAVAQAEALTRIADKLA